MRKTYLGTLYYGASDNFQRGLYRIARCLKAETHDLAVVEMIKLGVDTVNEENTIVKQASKQAEICRLGNLYGENRGTGFAGNVWDIDGLSPTITTAQGGGREPHILEVKKLDVEKSVVAYDEQNKCIREDVFGTLTTDGSSPKHNNRVIESKKIKIRQATKDGFVDCEIGGGGFGISIIGNTQGKSDRERKDMSDTNNGEYP